MPFFEVVYFLYFSNLNPSSALKSTNKPKFVGEGGETAKKLIRGGRGGGEQSEKVEIWSRGEGVKSEKKLGYPPAKWERKSFETRENV